MKEMYLGLWVENYTTAHVKLREPVHIQGVRTRYTSSRKWLVNVLANREGLLMQNNRCAK